MWNDLLVYHNESNAIILHRGNILFGSDWDEKRYKQVLFACALERDLDIFELGDQTICGSKGAVMSGGQKVGAAILLVTIIEAD